MGNQIQADIAHAIQLALAPVFLLTGIAGLLNVMASRLSRIIDRGRRLTETPGGVSLPPDRLDLELRSLERRRHYVGVAITACTVSALFVCLVIAMLFMEVLLNLPLKLFEGILFTGSMIALVTGLTFFLLEVYLAAQTVRFDHHSKTSKKDGN